MTILCVAIQPGIESFSFKLLANATIVSIAVMNAGGNYTLKKNGVIIDGVENIPIYIKPVEDPAVNPFTGYLPQDISVSGNAEDEFTLQVEGTTGITLAQLNINY